MKALISLALTLAIIALLVASYRTASIKELVAYIDAAAVLEPKCRSSTVLASLEHSLDSPQASRFKAAVAMVRTYPDMGGAQRQVTMERLVKVERMLWLLIITDKQKLAAAFCAAGGPGRDYNLPGIGAMVGIRDISRASPTRLRALTDLYVHGIGGRLPRPEIRARFQQRLAK